MYKKIIKTEKKGNVVLEIHDYQIILRINNKEFFANYDFLKNYNKKLTESNPILFEVMLWLLLYDLDTVNLENYVKIKQTGKAISSYSGGADSTALLSLFGGIPIHILRSYDINYENRQIKACNNVQSNNIITNFEKVREYYLGKEGFNVGIGYACMYLPILELLECDTIYFGVVFDDLGFYYSDPFSFNGNLTNSKTHKINKVLKNFDIKIKFPLAGYSEVLTTKIADESDIKNFSSCHTLGNSDNCNYCYKCFRKQGIRGNKIDLTNPKTMETIMKVLKKQPIKMASSTIWGIQNAGYKGTYFSRFYDVDVSWCERINSYYNDEFGIHHKPNYEFQTENDLKSITNFVNFINNKKLYL